MNNGMFTGLVNTRDLGGLPTEDGRFIRSGKLIRGGMLVTASEEDIQRLSRMADLIVDLRTDVECGEKPDPEIPGVPYLHLSVLPGFAVGVTRDDTSYEESMKVMSSDPSVAAGYMKELYRRFIRDPFIAGQYGKLVRLLLEERDGAVFWHCTAGKDRTGFGALIIEEILGVPRAMIREEYLLSNRFLEADYRAFLEKRMRDVRQAGDFSADAGDASREMAEKIRKAAWYLFFADASYLTGLYAAADETFGGFEGFIREGLRLTEGECARLRELYLT